MVQSLAVEVLTHKIYEGLKADDTVVLYHILDRLSTSYSLAILILI